VARALQNAPFMPKQRRVVCSAMVLLAAILSVGTVFAQARPSEGALPRDSSATGTVPERHGSPSVGEAYRVSIYSKTPGAKLEVLTLAKDVVVKCHERCEIDLPPGRYIVRQQYDDKEGPRQVAINVKRAGSYEIEDAHEALAALGLLATTAGAVGLFGGTALLVSGTCLDSCNDSPELAAQRRRYTTEGAVALIAGAVLIPVGLFTLIPNSHSRAHFAPITDVKMALAPQQNGGWLTLTGRF